MQRNVRDYQKPPDGYRFRSLTGPTPIIPGMRDKAPELDGPVHTFKRCVECGSKHDFVGTKCSRCQEWV